MKSPGPTTPVSQWTSKRVWTCTLKHETETFRYKSFAVEATNLWDAVEAAYAWLGGNEAEYAGHTLDKVEGGYEVVNATAVN